MFLIATFFDALLYGFGFYLLLNCLYLAFFALAGHQKLKPLAVDASKARLKRFCILIPAYRENVVILETVKAALAHSYRGTFSVVVIADGLNPETINTLQLTGAQVVEVNFEKSTKGKALLQALEVLPSNVYDIALVLDVDNIMGPNVLEGINLAFSAGYQVVQAHRTAKNTETAFALLDACNEEINNHIYRKGHAALGLSPALIGSGMAFSFSYLKKLLTGIGETVGEDKEMDFRIARDQVKICYLDNFYVYDEKVENAQVFTNQRTRWLAAQFEFMKKYAADGFVQLFRFGNYEFFNKVMQAFLVPRMLLIGLLGICFLSSWVLPVGPPVWFWAGLLVLLSATLLLSLPGRFYNKRLGQAIIRLPYALFCMVLALFRMKKTKDSFIPTPHKANPLPAQLPT